MRNMVVTGYPAPCVLSDYCLLERPRRMVFREIKPETWVPGPASVTSLGVLVVPSICQTGACFTYLIRLFCMIHEIIYESTLGS